MKKISLFLSMTLMAILLLPAGLMAQAYPALSWVDADGVPVRQVEVTLGEVFTPPTLTCDAPEILRSVTYLSSNESVAIIETNTGTLTILAAGTTSITAYFAGDETYAPGRAVYTLIVNEKTSPEPDCPDAHFNLPADNVLHLSVGDVVSVPELIGATGQILFLSAKTVENILVAELTEDDLIHAVAAGQAKFIGLYVQVVGEGSTRECEYSFDIEVTGAAQQKAKPELSFNPQEVSIEFGEVVEIPTIVNPHNIEFTPQNSKWYTAWDSPVAEVNEQTGEVIIRGVGDEIISFEFTGNDEYEPQIIGYNLHVSTTGLIIEGIVVRNSNKDDVLGDGGSVKYDPLTHTLTLTNAMLDGESFYHAPAHNKIAKTPPTMGSVIYYSDKAPLTIELIGGNAILNAPAAILSETAPIVMLSPEGAYGVARISGQVVGIKAEALKLYKCDVNASSAVAIAVNELGVATGAHLMAYGESFAIQANILVLAEDHEGEGIAILTEGVTFEKGKGFFKDDKMATVVEIGKVVIPAPDDEVTTIDFSMTDPEGNESVIFSASGTDTYNEETGQVELTTSLTDEQVENALETMIPGSSEWKAQLPGSITFDIPAGEGVIEIESSITPNYTLKLKLDGQPVVTLTTGAPGVIAVNYNVPVALHVVLYLQIEGAASAPARIAANKADEEPTIGATISSIKITPAKAPQAIDVINAADGKNAKVLLNGQLYIVRDGKAYTASGIEIR